MNTLNTRCPYCHTTTRIEVPSTIEISAFTFQSLCRVCYFYHTFEGYNTSTDESPIPRQPTEKWLECFHTVFHARAKWTVREFQKECDLQGKGILMKELDVAILDGYKAGSAPLQVLERWLDYFENDIRNMRLIAIQRDDYQEPEGDFDITV